MKQSILKRALLTACLGVSMASVAMAGPVGPVVIPQAGDVVVINHGPDMTFTGNINFDVESQTNNNLQIGSTVIPNVVYGAAFNKSGAPDTIIPAQTYVYVGTKDGANAFTEASDADKKGASWNVETLKKTKSGDVQLASRGVPEKQLAKLSDVKAKMVSDLAIKYVQAEFENALDNDLKDLYKDTHAQI